MEKGIPLGKCITVMANKYNKELLNVIRYTLYVIRYTLYVIRYTLYVKNYVLYLLIE